MKLFYLVLVPLTEFTKEVENAFSHTPGAYLISGWWRFSEHTLLLRPPLLDPTLVVIII